MAICKTCKKRKACHEICPELKKEISSRGISPRRKDKTCIVDFSLLEGGQALNTFQLEVRRSTIRDTFLKEITGIDLNDLMQKHLSQREKQAVQFMLEGYRHIRRIVQSLVVERHIPIASSVRYPYRFYLITGKKEAENCLRQYYCRVKEMLNRARILSKTVKDKFGVKYQEEFDFAGKVKSPARRRVHKNS